MKDLDLIKKYYGEKMMHYCRSNFQSVLETPGLLYSIIDSRFEHSKVLYEDIVNNNYEILFRNYILGIVRKDLKFEHTDKTPDELLDEAGYKLYVCNSESEIQSFKKYYKRGEELCTFKGDRLDTCYVFFAIKKDVEDIKREDFTSPKREDEYGTSVISIQFSRGDINVLSIKNRYNHKVENPDATFSNNLENIIPGLTESFTKKYGFNIQSNEGTLELPNYVFSNGKYYKYNYRIKDTYYCTKNLIIKDEEILKKYQNESERYIVADYYLIDLKEKKIELIDKNLKDDFPEANKNIQKIGIEKYDDGSRRIIITINQPDDVEIVLDKCNRIIGYRNDLIKFVGDGCMFGCKYLSNISLPNVERIDDDFLYMNNSVKELDLPNVKRIGYGCMHNNELLNSLNAPLLESIDDACFTKAKEVSSNTPNLINIGEDYLKESYKGKRL